MYAIYLSNFIVLNKSFKYNISILTNGLHCMYFD